MANRDRYITPAELGALLAEWRISDTVSQDNLLEFLERERMVLPVLRVVWPIAMVIEGRDEVPTPAPTAAERAATEALSSALRQWRRYDADPALEHPFDTTLDAAAALLVRDVSKAPFRPWADFAINVRPAGQPPLTVRDGIDTYYHGWQALLIADAAEMGAQLVLDTRRADLFSAVMDGKFEDLPSESMRVSVSFRAPRGLAAGVTWAPYFDAAARLRILRERRLSTLSRAHGGEAFTLSSNEQGALTEAQAKDAASLLAGLPGQRGKMFEFLRYLCERWDEWTRRDRASVASAYKDHLADALRLTMNGYGLAFPEIASEVGRVTGHFALTLDVVFPDWSTEARRKFEGSLKHGVVAHGPAAGPTLTLVDGDIPDLVDWLEAKDLWKVHLHVETIIERQFKGTSVDHSALAKEVEALGLTTEHLVSALLDEAGQPNGGTLMTKLYGLWQGQPGVVAALKLHKTLARTDATPRADQLVAINALTGSSDLEVAKVLLRAVLYRNDGIHNAMANWPEDELQACIRDFFTTLMFSRKVLNVAPPP